MWKTRKMKIKYLGHSCFILETAGKVLLFDPFISGNPLVKNPEIESLKPDYILVSHAHEDHTADLLTIARNSGAMIIAIWEIHAWLQKQGITNTHPMNIGGKRLFDFGKVYMTYAMHSSSFADGTYGGAAAGFLIEAEGKKVYYSGDTALNLEMKLLGENHAIDLALLPIGDNFTMGMQEAATAAKYLNTKKVVGLHYDTFGYIIIDHEDAKNTFQAAEVDLTLLTIGESLEF